MMEAGGAAAARPMAALADCLPWFWKLAQRTVPDKPQLPLVLATCVPQKMYRVTHFFGEVFATGTDACSPPAAVAGRGLNP